MSDVLTIVREIADRIEQLDNHEPLSPAERIELWISFHELGSAYRSTLRNLEDEAIEATSALTGGDHRQAVSTRFGTVAVQRKRGTPRVNGYRMLDALSERMASPVTGEVEHAVPVYVLRAVLPACSIDDYSSARFNLSALKGRKLSIAGRDVELDELVQSASWSETLAIVGAPDA